MSTFNQATIIGNLGNDPDVRATAGGDRVATLSLATSEKWTDDKGQPRERTEWHRVIAWRKLAEIVEKFVHKGDKLFVQGKIHYRSWQDKDGQTRYSTEIEAETITMLTPKPASARTPAEAGDPDPRD